MQLRHLKRLFFFSPLILWKVRRGSSGVKIFLGFYYASHSRRVSVICSSQLERLRCSPPPLAVLPAWRHLLIAASGPAPIPAASFSPLPPTVMAGALGMSWSRSSRRLQEQGILTGLLVTGACHPLTSRWSLSPASCLPVRRQSWMCSLYAVPFLSCLPSKCWFFPFPGSGWRLPHPKRYRAHWLENSFSYLCFYLYILGWDVFFPLCSPLLLLGVFLI